VRRRGVRAQVAAAEGDGGGRGKLGRKVLMRNRAQTVPLSCLKRAGRIQKDAPGGMEPCLNNARMREGLWTDRAGIRMPMSSPFPPAREGDENSPSIYTGGVAQKCENRAAQRNAIRGFPWKTGEKNFGFFPNAQRAAQRSKSRSAPNVSRTQSLFSLQRSFPANVSTGRAVEVLSGACGTAGRTTRSAWATRISRQRPANPNQPLSNLRSKPKAPARHGRPRRGLFRWMRFEDCGSC